MFGIQSTYFIMLRSPVYNLFSRENSEYLKKIIGFGHHIGLHYDDAYDISISKRKGEVVKEFNLSCDVESAIDHICDNIISNKDFLID